MFTTLTREIEAHNCHACQAGRHCYELYMLNQRASVEAELASLLARLQQACDDNRSKVNSLTK